jgi:hypothetical protein
MPPIYVPISSLDQWKALLAEPEKQWRTGFSARTIAHSWLAANGLPPEVSSLLASSAIEALSAVEPLFIIPEHKVILPPSSGHPSQNDVFVLGKGKDGGLVSIVVEGKVSEAFGPTLAEWNQEASQGKTIRLDFLKDLLSLPKDLPPGIRYQLLHRLASAVIEASHFGAKHAVMIVQSFSQSHEWLTDFEAFLALFGAEAHVGSLAPLYNAGPVSVFAGWAQGDPRFLVA